MLSVFKNEKCCNMQYISIAQYEQWTQTFIIKPWRKAPNGRYRSSSFPLSVAHYVKEWLRSKCSVGVNVSVRVRTPVFQRTDIQADMATDWETTGSWPVNNKYGLTSFISSNRPQLHVNLLTLTASITSSAQLRYYDFVARCCANLGY